MAWLCPAFNLHLVCFSFTTALGCYVLSRSVWKPHPTYLRKQFAVNKTFAAVKHSFSTFLRSLNFESIKCRWYWPDLQLI